MNIKVIVLLQLFNKSKLRNGSKSFSYEENIIGGMGGFKKILELRREGWRHQPYLNFSLSLSQVVYKDRI